MSVIFSAHSHHPMSRMVDLVLHQACDDTPPMVGLEGSHQIYNPGHSGQSSQDQFGHT